MRTSTVVSAFLVAGALGTPIKRDIVYDDVIVMHTITVYMTGMATGIVTPAVVTNGAIGTEAAAVTSCCKTSSYASTHRHGHHYQWNSSKLENSPAPADSTIAILTPLLAKKLSTPAVFTSEQPTSIPTVSTSEQPTSTPPVSIFTVALSPPPVQPSATPYVSTPAEVGESDGSPLSDGVSMLTSINKWRTIYKLPLLTWSHQLELNALKTGTDDGGHDEIHELNGISMAQVITPGMQFKWGGDLGGHTPFELSYVAWLCEVSTDPELKSGGIDHCKYVNDSLHMSYSDHGHYDILTSTSYSFIGCAFADDPNSGNDTPYQGLWVCDLA